MDNIEIQIKTKQKIVELIEELAVLAKDNELVKQRLKTLVEAFTLYDIAVREEFVTKHNEILENRKNDFKFEVKEIDGSLHLSERIEFKSVDYKLPKHPPISIRTNE